MEFKSPSAVIVSIGMLWTSTVHAQGPPSTDNVSKPLKIFVLQGHNAMNSIPGGRAIAPVIEVRDENDQPVEGAEVTFELPDSGPGGEFPPGRTKQTVRTNLQGQATVAFNPNQQPGRFEIKVTAQSENRMGQATIVQTNSMDLLEAELIAPERKRFGRWKLLAIGGSAAAAIIAVFLATRDGNGSGRPTVTIIPGGPVFSGSR